MRMTRLSRRRWLALAAGLTTGLAFGCGQQAAPAIRLPLPARARARLPRLRRRPRPARHRPPRAAPSQHRHRRTAHRKPAAQAAPAGGKRAEVITATQLCPAGEPLLGRPERLEQPQQDRRADRRLAGDAGRGRRAGPEARPRGADARERRRALRGGGRRAAAPRHLHACVTGWSGRTARRSPRRTSRSPSSFSARPSSR